MIKLCEDLEAGDFMAIKEELKQLGLKMEDFFKAEEEAVLFVEEVKQKILKGAA
ncbi:MAG: hypothetical protein GXO05_05130 [Aquificae bacterium]|nr:hypothetical protein [Aquificota bacterium]